MGKNPEIIKTITAHTKQEKHVMFKKRNPSTTGGRDPASFRERKETTKIKSNSHQGLSKLLIGRKEKFTNEFCFCLGRLWEVGKVKI